MRSAQAPNIPVRLEDTRRALPGSAAMGEVLDYREAETDQRHGRSQPRHHCPFEAETRAHPGKMTVRRHPDFKPRRIWGGACIRHA